VWVISVDLASYHPFGTQNFEMATRFLEFLCTTAYQHGKCVCLVIVGYGPG